MNTFNYQEHLYPPSRSIDLVVEGIPGRHLSSPLSIHALLRISRSGASFSVLSSVRTTSVVFPDDLYLVGVDRRRDQSIERQVFSLDNLIA